MGSVEQRVIHFERAVATLKNQIDLEPMLTTIITALFQANHWSK